MGMVASSVLLTVLVLNYHHRHPDTHNMPTWVSHYMLRMRRIMDQKFDKRIMVMIIMLMMWLMLLQIDNNDDDGHICES